MTRRIAIADDDLDFRSLLVKQLRREGFEVTEASDGLELVKAVVRMSADARPPHVVVTDVNMPRFDGLSVLRQLRKLYQTMPIVLITALPDAEVRKLADSFDHTHLMVKPFPARQLTEHVLGLPEPMGRPSWAA